MSSGHNSTSVTTLEPAADATTALLSQFDIVETAYKQVNGVPIAVSVLVPKNVTPLAKQPVMIRWHGGALITGHRLFPEWFSPWVLELALKKNAILVLPEYRLLPEAKGLDILQDSTDFYSWLVTSNAVNAHIPKELVPDLDHLLVLGESAGGWLALQAAFLPPQLRARVSLLVSLFPMIDLRDPHYTQAYHKYLFAPPAPQLDPSIWANHVAGLTGSEVATAVTPPGRLPLVLSAAQQGRFAELLGDDERMYPLEMLARVENFPPLWILHGIDDKLVPVEGTNKFVAALGDRFPSTPLHVSLRPGMHGFDLEDQNRVDDAWLLEGLAFADRFWP